VRVIDLAGATVRELSQGASEVQAVEIAGDWVVAHLRDGQLSRMKLDGSARASLLADGKVHWFELFPAGDLAYTDFSELRVWHADISISSWCATPSGTVGPVGPASDEAGGWQAARVRITAARMRAAGMTLATLRRVSHHPNS
jgi:hypothetical protein